MNPYTLYIIIKWKWVCNFDVMGNNIFIVFLILFCFCIYMYAFT